MDGESAISNEEYGLFLTGLVVAEYGGPYSSQNGQGRKAYHTLEIAFDQGMAIWTRFINLEDCPHWLDPDDFIDIPRFGILKPIRLRISRLQYTGSVVNIFSAEIVS